MQKQNSSSAERSRSIPQLRFPEFKDEWERKKLEDLAQIKYGKDQKQVACEDGKYPILGTGGEMGRTNEFLYDKPSVLIGRKGTIDKPRFMDTPFWTVDTLFYTEVKATATPKWLFYKFQTINWYLYNEASGVPSLSGSTIYKIPILVPTLPEQKSIASFFTVLDKKISVLKQKKTLLEQYKKGVMQKLFPSISSGQAPELRFKDDKGKDFPKWEKKKLGEVAIKKSSNIAANKIEENFGDYIIYGASGVLKKVDFYKEENDYVSIIKDGAGVGRIFYCAGKSSVLGTMEIIKPKLELNTYFLFCLLSNIDFVKYITGSTIPHIYFKDYSNEICGIPSLEEQAKITTFLSAIDEKINRTENQIQQTEQYKKGLLQKMFC
jgi:type I restriction enzyme, S subunit